MKKIVNFRAKRKKDEGSLESVPFMDIEELLELRPSLVFDVMESVLDTESFEVWCELFLAGGSKAKVRLVHDIPVGNIIAETPIHVPIHVPITVHKPIYVAPPKPCPRLHLKAMDGRQLNWALDIAPDIARKLWSWWMIHEGECSGMGVLNFDKQPDVDNEWIPRVEQITLLSDKNTAGHTDIYAKTMSEYYTSLPREKRKFARLWWHSHGSGAPFWSDTDVRNIQTFLDEQAMLNREGWIMSIVLGKKTDYTALVRFDSYKVDKDKVIHESAVDDIVFTISGLPEEVIPEQEAIREFDNKRRYRPLVWEGGSPQFNFMQQGMYGIDEQEYLAGLGFMG